MIWNKIAAQLTVMDDLKIDPMLGILKILELTGKADINKVIAFYQEIKSGKLKVAVVKSALDLKQAEKDRINKYLLDNITGKLVIIFLTDPELREGLVVKVGDDLIQFS